MCIFVLDVIIFTHYVQNMLDKTHTKFDDFDLGILNALSNDGALTNAQLGEIIGLSTSQCSRRRARLEANNVITGYQARLNPEAMGLSLRAVVRVNLHSHSEDQAKEFASLLRRHTEVADAFSVSGDADYVLIVQCENLTDFASFVHETLLPFDNISQVRSEIVLKDIFG